MPLSQRDDSACRALYRLDITDLGVDLRAQLFRECEAMTAYAASRGVALPPEARSRLDLLDVGILRRREIDMDAFLSLHAALSASIRPALPRAIEMMNWDAQVHPLLNRLAPIAAMRGLLLAAALFLALLLVTVSTGHVTPARIAASLFALVGDAGDAARPVFWMTAFYLALAGLGATFAVLYDARKHVVEGTYDPRLGSNYAIRIALGLISGLILAQILSDPELAGVGSGDGAAPAPVGNLELFGKPVLALLGGFAAQLVYTALSRFVGALESMFQPERAVEAALREREAQLAQRDRDTQERAARGAASLDIVRRMEAEGDPAARSSLIEELARAVTGAPIGGGVAGGGTATAGAAARGGPVSGVERAVAMAQAVAAALPDDRARAMLPALNAVASGVLAARTAMTRGAGPEAAALATEAARSLMQVDPVRQAVLGAVSALAGPLKAAAAATTPAGLALAVVTMAAQLGAREFGRWKARVLDAPYTPDLAPVGTLDALAVREALRRAPAFEAAMRAEIEARNLAALNDLGRAVLGEDDAALAALHGPRFGGDAAGFAAALAEFRRALLDDLVAAETPVAALAAAETASGRELLAAIDAARADPEGAAALEDLAVLALAARTPGAAAGPEELVARTREVLEEAPR